MSAARPLLAWLVAFAFTEIVEVPIYRRMLRSSFLEAFGASAVTHPLLWWVWVPWMRARFGYVVYAATGEALVVLVEALWFWLLFGRPRGRSFAASVVANGASYVLGLVAYAMF